MSPNSIPRVAVAVALLLATALVVAGAPFGESAITCSDVYSTLYPCLGYIQGGGAAPPPASCCGGIASLMAAARTGADRRTTCGCLKNVAAGVSGQNVALGAGLPAKCGVNVPYKISPSTDCAKVK